MNIIDMARQIGTEIQNDDRYIRLRLIEQKVEGDEELQGMIGKFNLDKMSLNNEMSKENVNQDKVKELNHSMRSSYEDIMKNPIMAEMNVARQEFETMLKRVNAIIMQSAQGEDPMTTDYKEESCGGSCSSCQGCH